MNHGIVLALRQPVTEKALSDGKVNVVLNKMQFRRWRQSSNFRTQTVKQCQAFEARWIEIVVNVADQVGSNQLEAQAQPGRPRLRDVFEMLGQKAVIPRLLENLGDCCAVPPRQRRTPNRPESKDE